jgi:hypothetical protein
MTTFNLKNTPPLTLTNLIVSSTIGGNNLDWNAPLNNDFWQTEIWSSSSNDRSGATLLTTTIGTSYYDQLTTNTTKYYWVRIKDKFDNNDGIWEPVSSTGGISSTSKQITDTDVDATIITSTSSSAASSSLNTGGGDWTTSGNTFGTYKDDWITPISTFTPGDTGYIQVNGTVRVQFTSSPGVAEDVTLDLRLRIVDTVTSDDIVTSEWLGIGKIDEDGIVYGSTMIPIFIDTEGNTINRSNNHKFVIDAKISRTGTPSASLVHRYTGASITMSMKL